MKNVSFNEGWYLSLYPDVRAAVEKYAFDSGFEHYQKYGYLEKREVSFRTEINFRPLHVLIHIPKTAGSTIINSLKNSGYTVASHIEKFRDNNDALYHLANYSDFVSGHIPFKEMRTLLSNHTSRKLIFHTFLREPTEQVASHYNWLIEVFYKGIDFYSHQPDQIQQASKKIRASDNADPLVVINNLVKNQELFLNTQTYYITEKRKFCSLEDEVKALDFIWRVSELELFFCELECEISYIYKSNKSDYHYKKNIFFESHLTKFLKTYNSSDIDLFEYVAKTNKSFN